MKGCDKPFFFFFARYTFCIAVTSLCLVGHLINLSGLLSFERSSRNLLGKSLKIVILIIEG